MFLIAPLLAGTQDALEVSLFVRVCLQIAGPPETLSQELLAGARSGFG
jgi:hypothetical protein